SAAYKDWEKQRDSFRSQRDNHEEETKRQKTLTLSQGEIRDYAEFLVKKFAKPGKVPEAQVLNELIDAKIATAKAIGPDADALSIGTTKVEEAENVPGVGMVTQSAKDLIEFGGSSADAIGVTR